MTVLYCAFLILLAWSASFGTLHKYLAAHGHHDTTMHVWVLFRDKPGRADGEPRATAKALQRRRQAGFSGDAWEDRPVSHSYIEQVKSLGARHRHTFKWKNAVSFAMHTSLFGRIDNLACVAKIVPVATFEKPRYVRKRILRKDNAEQISVDQYGHSLGQLAMIGIPQAHARIHNSTGEEPGSGVLIGVFDTGFLLEHDCFGFLNDRNSIIGDSDFVAIDGDVTDPNRRDSHGTAVLSLIGGYDPGKFMGAAWGAQFLLARTEYDPTELHTEEDNWAAAMVWAESLGVDIVNSSLGYRDGFTDSTDYAYEDMDGKTTIIAQAASKAAARGVLIVNAMGNEGAWKQGTLSSPADVEDVISVGMVNENREIDFQSSTGPTADGRIKPDLVAQGSAVVLPDLYTTNAYNGYGVGTSFASPLVAGLVALVKQTRSAADAQSIRNIVYSTCTFSPFQDTVDNIYGRGIPDAFSALLDSGLSYLSIVDSADNLVPGARVYRGGNELGVTDSFGSFVLEIDEQRLPDTLVVLHEAFNPDTVIIAEKARRITVRLISGYTVFFVVANTDGDTLRNAIVRWRRDSADGYRMLNLSYNEPVITVDDTGQYHFYATADLHYASDTISWFARSDTDTVVLQLPRWHVLTCVVRDSLKNPVTSGTITYRHRDSLTYSTATILDGRASVWYPMPGIYELHIRASGYEDLGPLTVDIGEGQADEMHFVMQRRSATVVRVTSWMGAVGQATVTWGRVGDALTMSLLVDSGKTARIQFDQNGEYRLTVTAEGFEPHQRTIYTSALQDTLEISLARLREHFRVILTDTAHQRVDTGTVYIRKAPGSAFQSYTVDSTGEVRIDKSGPGSYTLFAESFGYLPSAHCTFIASEGSDTLEISLNPRPVTNLAVYPNVISARTLHAHGDKSGIRVEFMAAEDNPREHSQLCRVSIRTIAGELIWEFAGYATQHKPVTAKNGKPLMWDGRAKNGETVTPGTYLITVDYADKVFLRKVLITG